MRSVRLDEALEARLEQAAAISGESVSAFIRRAIDERCGQVLGERLRGRLADVSGIVRSRGGRARETGRAFRGILTRRARAEKAPKAKR